MCCWGPGGIIRVLPPWLVSTLQLHLYAHADLECQQQQKNVQKPRLPWHGHIAQPAFFVICV